MKHHAKKRFGQHFLADHGIIDAIVRAIEAVTTNGPRTPDMGGQAATADVGRAVAEALASATA